MQHRVKGQNHRRPLVRSKVLRTMSKKLFRCAIYTRKSSEEGLDQAFTSLDAQRERMRGLCEVSSWPRLETHCQTL
jgi:hypothetical protein